MKMKGTTWHISESGPQIWKPLASIYICTPFIPFKFIFAYMLNLFRLHCFTFYGIQYLELWVVLNGFSEKTDLVNEWMSEWKEARLLLMCMALMYQFGKNWWIWAYTALCTNALARRWAHFTYLLPSGLAPCAEEYCTEGHCDPEWGNMDTSFGQDLEHRGNLARLSRTLASTRGSYPTS